MGLKRVGSSIVARKQRAVIGPTPGAVMKCLICTKIVLFKCGCSRRRSRKYLSCSGASLSASPLRIANQLDVDLPATTRLQPPIRVVDM
jgi:hypothetical protein